MEFINQLKIEKQYFEDNINKHIFDNYLIAYFKSKIEMINILININ